MSNPNHMLYSTISRSKTTRRTGAAGTSNRGNRSGSQLSGRKEDQTVHTGTRISRSINTQSGDDSPITASEIGKEKPLVMMDRKSILQGILFSEILEKPKSKRKGR